MSMTQEHRMKLENLFEQLLLISNNFSELEKEEVTELYLDHGEYGHALWTYAGICIEENKIPLSVECEPLISELSDLMNIRNSRSKDFPKLLDKLTYQ